MTSSSSVLQLPRWSWAKFVATGILFVVGAIFCTAGRAEEPTSRPVLKTRNVLLITVDGLRWQEVFGGAEAALIDKEAGGVKDVPAVKERFHRETPQESRETLMPFFWRTREKKAAKP